MRRSSAQRSGMNDIPLGSRRRFGGGMDDEGDGVRKAPPTFAASGTMPGPGAPVTAEGTDGATRKRRSRWGDETTSGPGDAAAARDLAITAKVDSKEVELYSIRVRLEEIQRKLRTGDFLPPAHLPRSPSPPPQYDSQGKRSNTREVRYRQKYDLEQNRLIDRAQRLDPSFRPPLDPHLGMAGMMGALSGSLARRAGGKYSEKVYVPVNEFPEINFIGLLIGPRGNTLKTMERESGAKIGIRGKGSVKEGKGRSDAAATSNQEEDLHCVVTAEVEEKVRKAIQLINQVIETAASVPESANDHKRNQLRLLAELNGTLRDDENQVCQNCGNVGHRRFDCPEQRNVTRDITCRQCGGMGHIARDCPQKFAAAAGPMGGGARPGAGGNTEFDALMRELGEGGGGAPLGALTNGPAGQDGVDGAPGAAGGAAHAIGGKVPPWRDPSFWNPPAQPVRGPPMMMQQQHNGMVHGRGPGPFMPGQAHAHPGYPGGPMQAYPGGAYDAYFAHSQQADGTSLSAL